MNIKEYIAKINDKETLKELFKFLQTKKFERTLTFVLACIVAINLSTNNKQSKNRSHEYGPFEQSSSHDYTELYDTNEETIKQENLNIDEIIIASYNTSQSIITNHTDEVLNPTSSLATENNETKEPKELTNAEKKAIILTNQKITETQFQEFIRTVFAEGGGSYYDECYNVTSTILNRKKSIAFTTDASKSFGKNLGFNIYCLLTAPHQFSGYKDANYYYWDNFDQEYLESLPGYQAIIDCLYTEQTSHDYLSFKGIGCNPEGKVQLCTPYGNYYHNQLKEEDTIPLTEQITYPYGEEAENLYNTSLTEDNEKVLTRTK